MSLNGEVSHKLDPNEAKKRNKGDILSMIDSPFNI